MRGALRRFLLAAGFLLAIAARAQEDRFAAVEIQTVPAAPSIYMLVGEGGNIGLLTGADGVFMIDDQFAPLTEKILAAVAALSDQPLRFLINTHWHPDHTGGNENLGRRGALVVAHDNVHKRMSRDMELGAFGTVVPAAPVAALPRVTFNDSVTFRLNGEEVRVTHYRNAHTDGDSVVYFRNANVVHAGDLWFNGSYPFIDVSSRGSVDGLIDGVREIIAMADDETRIIPGHGPLGNKRDLQSYLEMLETARERMNALIAQGKSLEEIIRLKPNADYDEALGNGFIKPDKFLQILHSSLAP